MSFKFGHGGHETVYPLSDTSSSAKSRTVINENTHTRMDSNGSTGFVRDDLPLINCKQYKSLIISILTVVETHGTVGSFVRHNRQGHWK